MIMRVLRSVLLSFLVLVSGTIVAIYLLTIPLMRRLPKQKRVAMEGITDIRDAIAACQHTGLQGWELVAFAQNLTARKFIYSRLNPWDTPAQAFARGRGYCQQQALALKEIYDGLGIKARPVYALRCKFPPAVIDGKAVPESIGPHSWLRVVIGNEERDVCPHSVNNRPGVLDFELCSQVHGLHPFLQPFSHLGSVVENIRRDQHNRHAEYAIQPPPLS